MPDNRLNRLLRLRSRNLLAIYFTAGYPKLEDTLDILLALEKSGVDLVEIGIPYSDPMADGPVIQESGMKAISNGMSLKVLFGQLQGIRKTISIPLLMMGYFNQMLQYGVDAFLDDCVETGIDGLIIPDLPLYEYETLYREKFLSREISICFLLTPQTEEARIREIDRLSTGFIYVVSDSSITGVKEGISPDQLAYFERIGSLGLETPQLIGFGISNSHGFETVCRHASGGIIGSAFIRHLGQGGNVAGAVATFVESIRHLKP